MNRKKKNRVFLLLILLLGISVGFAALATTLKINGSASITKNNWNIYWDNISNQKGVTPTVSEIVDEDTTHKKNIVNFEVTFDQPGDYYEFEVDAVNAGTIDAEVLSIEKKYNDTVIPASGTSPLPSYLKYEVTYADGSEISIGNSLAKAPNPTATPPVYTTKTYKVRVEYDKDAVTSADLDAIDDEGDTHTFSFKVDYGQASSSTVPAPVAFATDSWETIASVGALADPTTGPYQVGDTKTIEMDLDDDGTNETYNLRIANLSKPSECSGEGFSQTACGLVIEFADVITTRRMNPYDSTSSQTDGLDSAGGWKYSDMRSYLNGTVYAYENIDYTGNGIIDKLPADLKSAIIDTQVVSGHNQDDSSNFDTTDKLYLFDSKEIYGDSFTYQYNTAIDSERQLDYYKLKGVTTSNYSEVMKQYNGSVMPWWLRSAAANYDYRFFDIYPGESTHSQSSDTLFGVSPAFRLG